MSRIRARNILHYCRRGISHSSVIIRDYGEITSVSESHRERSHGSNSRQIVPCFYRYLQAQESDKQIQYGKDLLYHLGKVVKEMDAEGPFFAGKEIGWVDIILAPWAFRFGMCNDPSILSD